MPPQRVGFRGLFGIHFAHFGLESSMVFDGTTGVYESIYRFSSKWVRKKETCQFKMDFWKCFCLRSNLSKDGRISALRPGLKTGVENDINPNPTKSFQEFPPPPQPSGHKIILSLSFILFRFNSYNVQEIFTNEQRIILSCSSHKYLVAQQGRFWPSNYKVLSWSSVKELRFLFHPSEFTVVGMTIDYKPSTTFR